VWHWLTCVENIVEVCVFCGALNSEAHIPLQTQPVILVYVWNTQQVCMCYVLCHINSDSLKEWFNGWRPYSTLQTQYSLHNTDIHSLKQSILMDGCHWMIVCHRVNSGVQVSQCNAIIWQTLWFGQMLP
jgi:hypothetical protein